MNATESRRHEGATISEDRLAVILNYLRERTGLRDFPALVDRIRDGDRHAAQEYREHTLCLARKDTWGEWSGPESPDSICRCLNSIVTHAQTAWAPASPPIPPPTEAPRDQAPPVLLPSSGTMSAAEIVTEILSAVRPTGSASNSAATDSPIRHLNWTPTNYAVRWRDLARAAGFDFKRMSAAAIEILDMLARVLIEGKGWGPKDRMRGKHRVVQLSPSRMSAHGQERNRRTYQRQYARLVALGLVLELRREPGGTRVVAPAWWEPYYTNDGLDVWKEATRRLENVDDCRGNAPATPQVDPEFAAPVPHHPVRRRSQPSRRDQNGFRHHPLRQSKGRC